MGNKYKFRDNVFTFEGAVSIYEAPDYVQPMRIPWEFKELYPVVQEFKAKQASGVRICFTTNANKIVLEIENKEDKPRLDLLVNSILIESVTCAEEIVEFKELPEGDKEIEIWLDPCKEFKLRQIIIEEAFVIRKTIVKQKRWIHYGSSISHSMEARIPSEIWTGIVSQKLGLHLTNLGFHSECKCDSMMGLAIRDIPADFITMKLGINLVDGDLNRRTFKPAIFGIVKIIRDKKPTTPIVICSPIYSPLYEEKRGGSDFNLVEMREEVKACVAILKNYGDENIYYSDGLEIFGEAYSNFMPDDLHPNAEGQYVMAENFIDKVFKKYLL